MSTERLVIDIEGNATKFNAAMQSAVNRLGTFNQRVTNSSRNLTRLQKQMAALGTTVTGLNGALAAATTRINSMGTGAGRAANNMARANTQSRGLTNSFRQMVVGLSSVQTMFYQYAFFVGGFVASVIKINAEYEKQTVLLKNLSRESTEAGKAMEAKRSQQYIWDLATKAPFSLQSLTDSFVKFKAGGIDPTNGSMKALVDSVAAFGGSSEQLKRASVAIQQMAGKGVVSMEELRQQLGEAVPDAMKLMANAMNMTMNDFVDAVSKGTVVAKPALQKMLAEMNRVHGGASEQMMNTWDGLMARLITAYSKFVISINKDNKGGLFQTLKSQLVDLERFFSSAKGVQFANDVMTGLGTVVRGFANLIKFVYAWRDTIISAAKIFFTMWAGKQVYGAIKLLLTAFTTLIVGGSRAIVMFKAFTVGSAAAGAATMRTTAGVRALATALGVANVAGRITIAQMGLLAARFTLVGAAAIAASYLVYRLVDALNAQAQAKARVAQAERANQNGGVLEEKDLKAGINKHNQEAATWREQKADLDRRVALYKRAGREIPAALKGQIERNNAEQQRLQKQGRVWVEQSNRFYKDASDQTISQLEARYGQRAQGVLRKYRTTYLDKVAELDARETELAKKGVTKGAEIEKIQKERDAARRAYDEGKLKRQEHMLGLLDKTEKMYAKSDPARAQAARNAKQQLEAEIQSDKSLNEGSFDPNAFTKGKNKEKKEKEPKSDGLDGLRNRFVTLTVAGEEMRHELENIDGEFDSWDAEEKAQKVADALKSEVALRERIAGLRDANKILKKQGRVNDGLKDLQGETAENAANAVDAIEEQAQGYDSLITSLDVYKNKLQDRYRKEIELAAELDAALGTTYTKQYRDQMDNAVNEKRRELLAEYVGDVKKAHEDILTTLMTEDERREYFYKKDVERVTARIALLDMSNAQEAKMAQDLYAYLETLRKQNEERRQGPFAAWAREAADMKPKIQDALVSSLDSFIDKLAEGKFAFKDFAMSLLKDIAKIIIRAMIARAILAAIGMASSTGPVVNTGVESMSSVTTPVLHTGGIVGGAGGMSRAVASGMFNFAQRYHTGGIVGLKPNEVPIIAEKGEGVFTQDQMKTIGNKQQASNVQVNVINQTGTDAEVERKQPTFDGEKWVENIILKKMTRPGPVRDALGRR
jgi:tape measure domain-containing protein